MFLSFTRPRAELTRMYLPSKSNQIGVTCGPPFGITVARLANAFFVVTRSRNSGGIVPRVAMCWGVWPPSGRAVWTPSWPRRAQPAAKSPTTRPEGRRDESFRLRLLRRPPRSASPAPPGLRNGLFGFGWPPRPSPYPCFRPRRASRSPPPATPATPAPVRRLLLRAGGSEQFLDRLPYLLLNHIADYGNETLSSRHTRPPRPQPQSVAWGRLPIAA